MRSVSQKVSDYFERWPDRDEARRRIPGWAKLLQFVIWVPSLLVLTLSWFYFFSHLHLLFHPFVSIGKIDASAGVPMMIGGIIAALFLSLIFTNAMLWLIPPARRAHEIAATISSELSFRKATMGLLIGASFIVPICLLLAFVGAWEPWL